ncbi:MAG: hypothetical protein ABI923_00855 [bacterium]
MVSFTAFAYGKGETNSFNFNSQLGVVDVRSQGELCLTIPNANLSEGSRIQIVSPYRPQSVVTAIVQRKLPNSCSRNPDTNPNDSFYSLKLVNERLEPEGVGIAIVGVRNGVRIANGLASVDLNGDGRREYFRVCTSHEGLHLTVWSGRPLRGVRRWHWYYYLGYDVVPSCTNREAR